MCGSAPNCPHSLTWERGEEERKVRRRRWNEPNSQTFSHRSLILLSSVEAVRWFIGFLTCSELAERWSDRGWAVVNKVKTNKRLNAGSRSTEQLWHHKTMRVPAARSEGTGSVIVLIERGTQEVTHCSINRQCCTNRGLLLSLFTFCCSSHESHLRQRSPGDAAVNTDVSSMNSGIQASSF